jgi:hypothetical protein
MPRRQYRHSKAAIHDRHGAQWDNLEPLYTMPLSPEQIREKRLELAQEMLTLLLGDGELAKRPRQALQRISTSLGDLRRLL